jgi:hypothetical protein
MLILPVIAIEITRAPPSLPSRMVLQQRRARSASTTACEQPGSDLVNSRPEP